MRIVRMAIPAWELDRMVHLGPALPSHLGLCNSSTQTCELGQCPCMVPSEMDALVVLPLGFVFAPRGSHSYWGTSYCPCFSFCLYFELYTPRLNFVRWRNVPHEENCFPEPNGSWFADWELKNWCFWTVVLKKTLESPLDFKEIQPVHPKGNQS